MIQGFTQRMGAPGEVHPVFGGSAVGATCAFWRRAFRQAGYTVNLTNEHRTSTPAPAAASSTRSPSSRGRRRYPDRFYKRRGTYHRDNWPVGTEL